MDIISHADHVGMALHSWFFMSACNSVKLSSVVEKLASFESPYDDTVLPPAYGHGHEKCIMY